MTDAKHLAGFDERTAAVKAVTMRYFVAGAGDPLVLIHGLGGAASNWSQLAPALARDHRVLAVDLPGHGGSSALPAVSGLEPYADRVAAVAELEGMLPCVVVGHSLGGVVALRLALRRPEAVSALVLASAAGISSTSRFARRSLAILGVLKPGKLVAPHRERIGRSPLLRTIVFGLMFVADPPALSPPAAEGFLAGHALHTDYASAWKALVLDDPRAELDQVRCPCLVVWGARDRQLPLEDAFDYARRLRAPLRVIADCGHLLIGERPDACLNAIRDFLAEPGLRAVGD